MWSTEHSVEAVASPESFWRLWRDVPQWPAWNAGVERADISGPFATGSTISMTPPGEDPILLRLVDVVEPEHFVDEARLGELVVRTTHRIESLEPGRLRVVYRMEISGPDADTVGPELGPQISGDFPMVLANLAARAVS